MVILMTTRTKKPVNRMARFYPVVFEISNRQGNAITDNENANDDDTGSNYEPKMMPQTLLILHLTYPETPEKTMTIYNRGAVELPCCRWNIQHYQYLSHADKMKL